jgi:hypothetical protein
MIDTNDVGEYVGGIHTAELNNVDAKPFFLKTCRKKALQKDLAGEKENAMRMHMILISLHETMVPPNE